MFRVSAIAGASNRRKVNREMKLHVWTGLLLVLLLATACAALPPAAPESTLSTPTEPVPTEPAPGELMPAVIPEGWQVYTNSEGFAISYPPSWTAQREPDANDGALHTQALRGPEGEVYLSWGTGFGGACPSGYSDVQVAEGTVQACYAKNDDGRESWTQMNRELPATSFSARALTQDGQAASHDLVLQILSTLTFAGAEAAPGLQPPAAEVCNGMAQALMQAITTEVTQAGEPVEIIDPVTMATGTACRAMSTGTGLDFAGPDVPIKALGRGADRRGLGGGHQAPGRWSDRHGDGFPLPRHRLPGRCPLATRSLRQLSG
jgi:hypothetical protein